MGLHFLRSPIDIAWWPQEQPTLLVNLVAAVCQLVLARELLRESRNAALSPAESEDP